MTVPVVLDSAGRRRSPATMPGYHAGRRRATRACAYPADPPMVEEIVAVMRCTREDRHGWRLRAMIVVLWRAGLRIQEALALAEHDLDPRRESLLVRNGKGGRRRDIGMDDWGWEQLRPWLGHGPSCPPGRSSPSSTTPPYGVRAARDGVRAWEPGGVGMALCPLSR
jgi:integrase